MRRPHWHEDEGAHLKQAGAATLREAAAKVPEITIGFWVIKILTTGMGETTSDFLVRSFDPPLARLIHEGAWRVVADVA